MPIKEIVISASDRESDWIKYANPAKQKRRKKKTTQPEQKAAHLAIVANILNSGYITRHLSGKHSQKLHAGKRSKTPPSMSGHSRP